MPRTLLPERSPTLFSFSFFFLSPLTFCSSIRPILGNSTDRAKSALTLFTSLDAIPLLRFFFFLFSFLQRSTHSKSETIRILISRRKYWTQLLLETLLKPHNVIIIRYYHCIMNDGKSRISQDRISAMEESERVVIFRG